MSKLSFADLIKSPLVQVKCPNCGGTYFGYGHDDGKMHCSDCGAVVK